MLGAAVVLFQADGPAAFELLLKRENVLNGGAAEAVDALVVIADDAEIAVLSCQKRDQQILQMVRVLILIHHDVFETPLPEFAPILEALQQKHRIEDEVVKIHGVGGEKPAAVFRIEFRNADAAGIMALLRSSGILLGQDLFILGSADRGQNGTGRINLFVQVPVLQDALHQTQAVAGVINAETGAISQYTSRQ